MTNIEVNAFRTILETRQAELGNGNRLRETLTVEATPDDLDRIQQASEHDYVVGNLQRNANQLNEVQDALSRIEEGTYGICVGCEENINPKRLVAVPWASSCIVCQEARELGLEMPETRLYAPLDLAA